MRKSQLTPKKRAGADGREVQRVIIRARKKPQHAAQNCAKQGRRDCLFREPKYGRDGVVPCHSVPLSGAKRDNPPRFHMRRQFITDYASSYWDYTNSRHRLCMGYSPTHQSGWHRIADPLRRASRRSRAAQQHIQQMSRHTHSPFCAKREILAVNAAMGGNLP
jgi:hypothetical protein